jgi:hypothetical protein
MPRDLARPSKRNDDSPTPLCQAARGSGPLLPGNSEMSIVSPILFGYPYGQMSQKPGRNDPCPCGSGKKYKKCCGRDEPVQSLLLPDDQRTGTPIDEYFVLLPFLGLHEQKIIQFEKDGPALKKDRNQFEKRYRPGREDGLLDSHYMSWYLFDHRFGPSRATIVERVLADPMTAKLVEPGPTFLRHMAESYATFYGVIEAGPEVVVLDELGTGRRWHVHYFREMFESVPETGMVWYTRLVGPPERALSYTTPYVFDPETRAQFERGVRGLAADFAKSEISIGVPSDRLFAESQKAAVPFWAEYIRVSNMENPERLSSVPSEWTQSNALCVANTDGEDLVFTETHFQVKDEKAVRKKLAALRSFEYDEKEDSWTWLKAKSRITPDDPRTQLGHFKFKDGRLVAETNSRERATRLEWKLAGHLRGLIKIEKKLYRDLEDLPKPTPEEMEASRKEDETLKARPEVQEALRRQMEAHYFRKWPRTRIPALGNITPLQAAKTEKGRKKLEDLLEYMERRQGLEPTEHPQIDFDRLRRTLGLGPKAN